MFPFITTDGAGDDDDKQTWPPIGSAKLSIEQETNALFYSATWLIRARVNGKIFAESNEVPEAVPQGEVRQWARAVIRKSRTTLQQMGVDTDTDYVMKWGGVAKDLT